MVNDNEQDKLKNNVVLHNLPSIEQHQTKQTLINVANKLEIKLAANNIESVHRYSLKTNNKFDYVYKLNKQEIHSELLIKRKTKKLILQPNQEIIQCDNLSTEMQPQGSKIIINEHITQLNYNLLQKARSLSSFD